MRYHSSVPAGYSRQVLRHARNRYHLDVEIHHVVPRQFASHPVLKYYGYDVESDYNLMLMPSRSNMISKRPNHTGGHMKYNDFVASQLSETISFGGFVQLLCLLHWGCRGRRTIPWK